MSRRSSAAVLDPHIPAVADSTRRLVEAERSPADRVLVLGAYRTTVGSLLSAARAGLPVTYGSRNDLAIGLVREGLLEVSGGWFELTAAGVAALEGAGL